MKPSTAITFSAEQLEGTQATFDSWLVAVGDSVTSGQPLAELETDKVIMEVISPINGIIESLLVKQGEDVKPLQKLGTVSTSTQQSETNTAHQNPVEIDSESILKSTAETALEDVEIEVFEQTNTANLLSPAVRRLLSSNNLNVNLIKGSGKDGRVTRDDVTKYLQSSNAKTGNLSGTLIPHTKMRKSIANHMVDSLLNISPHVTSVFEMDLSKIIAHRKLHKQEFEAQQIKLTFTAYFLTAMAEAVATVPQVNARFHADALEIFSDVNIGVGTSLGEGGLVVPVVQQVQTKSLLQIAKDLTQQTEKARNNKLTTTDMKNGTLTISNHGVSGSLFATPIIINQPQVAIVGIGKLEKRVVVEEINGADAMVIRPKCYVSLSIDHRALDAHQTNLYLSEFVRIIENWSV
jgi:2-oxoglutarate dehydrogenase E2 component (dihydrolipoamide succinyltransferase)